jgi:hypothetical protein
VDRFEARPCGRIAADFILEVRTIAHIDKL